MNYLAHLLLADDNAESMIGNLLPDFVRGPKRADWPAQVWRGVERHRRVDRFTDTHPITWRSRRRLGEEYRRFSGILVDVFYDHVLARNWPHYHAWPLDQFTRHAYATLRSRPDLLGPAMTAAIDRMTADDWLGCYATVDGVANVLGMMSRRISKRVNREIDLAPAAELLIRHGPALGEDFRAYYAELRRWLDRPDMASSTGGL